MAKLIFTTTFPSPIGDIWLGEYEQQLCFLQLPPHRPLNRHLARLIQQLNATLVEQETPLLQQAKQQLNEYFHQKRQQFDLPLFLQGTPFQKQVWQALLQIPYGETRSYKAIAEQLGNPNAMRAVGGANNANRLAIIVPCHRVIQQNGTLGGYEFGLDTKQFLLRLEYLQK